MPLGERPKTERKFCIHCRKRLRAHYGCEWTKVTTEHGYEDRVSYNGKVHGYGYRSSGLFCNGGCAYDFAVTCALLHSRRR